MSGTGCNMNLLPFTFCFSTLDLIFWDLCEGRVVGFGNWQSLSIGRVFATFLFCPDTILIIPSSLGCSCNIGFSAQSCRGRFSFIRINSSVLGFCPFVHLLRYRAVDKCFL